MASSTRPATDAEWDRHKAIIHSLFLCREASMAELVTELTGRGLVVTYAIWMWWY
jgi:hypothetical protein